MSWLKVVLLLTVILYNNQLIKITSNTKFVETVIENSLSWKAQIDQLFCIAYYAIRATKTIYAWYPKVGILFLLSLLCIMGLYAGEILHIAFMFLDNKKGLLNYHWVKTWRFCRELFKKIEDITISIAIHIFTLSVVNNKDRYQLNSEIHFINTRHNSILHHPLTKHIKKGPTMVASRFLIIFLLTKKLSHNDKKFRLAFSDLFYLKSFILWMSILIVVRSMIWFYFNLSIINYSCINTFLLPW
jgi:hypothetical protein